MKSLFATTVFLTLFSFSALAQANLYKMKMELSLDGKIVARPTVVTTEGEKASISETTADQKTFYIEVIAKETGDKKAIQMNFTVGSDEAGKKTVLGTPQVITKPKKQATITVAESDGSKSMTLKVLVERVKK